MTNRQMETLVDLVLEAASVSSRITIGVFLVVVTASYCGHRENEAKREAVSTCEVEERE